MKWEYKTLVVGLDGLNELGADGWELVAALPELYQTDHLHTQSGAGNMRVVLKRPLKDDLELVNE